MQLNLIDLQFLQEVANGFFIFYAFLRSNQWVNDGPPSGVVNRSSCIGQQESIDIEKRRSIHPSQSSILHVRKTQLIKHEKVYDSKVSFICVFSCLKSKNSDMKISI